MRYKKKGLRSFATFSLGAVLLGLFTFSGCEKAKPTVGDQVGAAIDNTIQATDQAVQETQQTAERTKKEVSQQTRDLRDAFKQAVDDHLGSGDDK